MGCSRMKRAVLVNKFRPALHDGVDEIGMEVSKL